MKWFDKWFYKQAKKAWANEKAYEEDTWLKDSNKLAIGKLSMGTMAIPKSLGNHLESNGLKFNLYKATGGFVIETQHYDQRTDRHQTHLYVVNSDQDIGQEIGKIITLESLRS
jgi:hypothetical protein